MRLGSGQYRER